MTGTHTRPTLLTPMFDLVLQLSTRPNLRSVTHVPWPRERESLCPSPWVPTYNVAGTNTTLLPIVLEYDNGYARRTRA